MSDFMKNPKSFFTSESVTEGHPDKLCDQISDGVLDAILAQDSVARVACETATTTGLVLVAGEITTSAWVDIPAVVRKTIEQAGYINADYGFDYRTCGVVAAPLLSCVLMARARSPYSMTMVVRCVSILWSSQRNMRMI